MPCLLDFGCPNDKPLGRISDVAEGIAGNQRQRRAIAWSYNIGLIGHDDRRRINPILRVSFGRFYRHHVTAPNAA